MSFPHDSVVFILGFVPFFLPCSCNRCKLLFQIKLSSVERFDVRFFLLRCFGFGFGLDEIEGTYVVAYSNLSI